ncbi:hypothetical protein SISSUDRAFT_1032047 [Sistotremastrum suecicum HHB10207 ss-3]|uniref:Uncharacterized protein n=1 Tax=Sistotremastrum suecicum HHB10207 ss-3 TaxID=1314776 RepID=A0A166F2T3_9AGAM|nr:hypothetical protein SISSUDRAFT_1032047 [Sistotremastrum suecicum HHB10207 ss-3]
MTAHYFTVAREREKSAKSKWHDFVFKLRRHSLALDFHPRQLSSCTLACRSRTLACRSRTPLVLRSSSKPPIRSLLSLIPHTSLTLVAHLTHQASDVALSVAEYLSMPSRAQFDNILFSSNYPPQQSSRPAVPKLSLNIHGFLGCCGYLKVSFGLEMPGLPQYSHQGFDFILRIIASL